MAKISHSADCGNSPKNKAVADLAIAIEGGPWSDQPIGDETVWVTANSKSLKGLEAIKEVAEKRQPKSISIERVATHGKVGAASGISDGQSFAHIITFSSASAKEVAAIDSFRKDHHG
tara:strand:- start:193 stop:546 length:354 start_codon:yes stop_codon:yes gene_type:complete